MGGSTKFKVDLNGVITGNGSGLTGVSASPAGVAGSLQFDNAGAMGGDSGFTYAGSGAATINGAAATALSVTTSSTTGTAVIGTVSAGTGTNYGVYGSAASMSGYGVYGTNSQSGGTATGVYGTAPNGYGVWGNSNGGSGVYGTSSAGTAGVYGNSTGASYGVYGTNTAASAPAIYGYSNGASGIGVKGQASSGYGVYGVSNAFSGVGGYFTSTSGYALITGTGNVGIGTAAPVDPFAIGTAPTGSATHALVNLNNTALVGASASGTYIGANPASAGADFINYQVGGSTKFKVDLNGVITGNGSGLTGVSAAPAGVNTQIQFNNSNAMGASSNLTWNNTNQTVTVSGLSSQSSEILNTVSTTNNISTLAIGPSAISGNTGGAAIGVNSAPGYSGDLLNLQINGATKLEVALNGVNIPGGNLFAGGYSTTNQIMSVPGSGDACLGENANNCGGTNNTYVGSNVNWTSNATSSNTGVGAYALNHVGDGINTGVGSYALSTLTNHGQDNAAVGYYALGAVNGGSAGQGSYNTAIGDYAGYGTTGPGTDAVTTGTDNTFLGYNAAPGTATQLTNATAIGANASVTASNSLILGSGANVGIGTTAPTSALEVHGGAIVSDSGSTGTANVNFGTGNVQVSTSTATTINVCGLKDGGSYMLVLPSITGGSTVTINAYSDTACTVSISHVDLGSGVNTFTSNATNTTNIVSLIYLSSRSTVYGVAQVNYKY